MNIARSEFVTGAARLLLRLKGLAVLARSCSSPRILACWAYLAGSRAGAAAYNSVNSYVAPLALAAWALASQRPETVALIWIAHIGFDRLVGYGLKYPTAFRDTHLGQLARPRDREASG